jgi:tripartite ATP-independent transporter DctM subunit
MILFGWITGTSITACFLAPVVPGFLLIALFALCNRILVGRMDVAVAEPAGFGAIAGDFIRKTRRASLALLMPVIILGFIYGGITTPTEAAAVAVIYALPVSLLIYRDMNLKDFWEVLWRSGQTAGVLLVLVFFAAMLSRLFTLQNVPQEILEAFLAVTSNPIGLLLLANLFLMLIGMFMEDVSGILLAAPLLMPVMLEAGVDPVQFAAIIAVNLGMGLITPPTAPILYFGALIGKTQLGPMLKPAMIFVCFAYLPVVLLTTFIPQLSMALPRLVLGLP